MKMAAMNIASHKLASAEDSSGMAQRLASFYRKHTLTPL
jgi:hypothetical protein